MRLFRVAPLGLLTALLAGCSSTPPQKPQAVDVTVSVSLPSGQPAKDVMFMLFPTSSEQMQGGGKTDAKGVAKMKAIPGKYTYAFDGAPKTVPQKYHSNEAAHTLEVPAVGGDIAVKLTN